jgi:hypothetical protein
LPLSQCHPHHCWRCRGHLATAATASPPPLAISSQEADEEDFDEGEDGLTRVVCLHGMVTIDDLKDDAEYSDILQDVREECGGFGTVLWVQSDQIQRAKWMNDAVNLWSLK